MSTRATDRLDQHGKHAAGPLSRIERARGWFLVATLLLLVLAVAGAVLHADLVVAWLSLAWLVAFLALYIGINAVAVRNRPPGVSRSAAAGDAYGIWPLRVTEVLSLSCLVAVLVVLSVKLVGRL